MIKKQKNSQTDLETWKEFINNPSDIYDKEDNSVKEKINRRYKFDLHGFSLLDANKKVEELIFHCVNKGYKEILLITGKGLHSNQKDVYKSSDLNKLRFSVPDFINSDPEISKLILSMVNPSYKEGGEGALLIKLKKL